ncbi:MAG: hypothetical protein M3P49_09670, partial [Actinomycetota bacterium]|nr:hypothetical protein [Actinomycetota bacterium]
MGIFWNPAKHPRGPDGKFIRVRGFGGEGDPERRYRLPRTQGALRGAYGGAKEGFFNGLAAGAAGGASRGAKYASGRVLGEGSRVRFPGDLTTAGILGAGALKYGSREAAKGGAAGGATGAIEGGVLGAFHGARAGHRLARAQHKRALEATRQTAL